MSEYQSCSAKDAKSIFDQAYYNHAIELGRHARKLVEDDHDAEDVVQNAFSALYRMLLSGHRPDNFGSWLCGVVRNTVLEHQRQKRNLKPHNLASSFVRRSKDGDDVDHEPEDPGLTPEPQAVRCETIQKVRECLDELSVEQREAIVLTKIEGMTVDEAADVLRIPVPTLKSRLRVAKHLLRDMLLRTDENLACSMELTPGSS